MVEVGPLIGTFIWITVITPPAPPLIKEGGHPQLDQGVIYITSTNIWQQLRPLITLCPPHTHMLWGWPRPQPI